MTDKSKALVLGINFDKRNGAEALVSAIGYIGSTVPASVVTPNIEILLACRSNSKLKSIINSADLVLCDGVGVLLLSRILSFFGVCEPLNARVPGISLGEALLGYAAKSSLPVFFLGGMPGVAERAAKRLSRIYPGLSVVGTADGYNRTDKAVSLIYNARPSIVFVCLGSPLQEYWISENARYPALYLALGGSLDIWSGDKKRAPPVACALGLEWLFRFAAEPKRIARFMSALFRINRQSP